VFSFEPFDPDEQRLPAGIPIHFEPLTWDKIKSFLTNTPQPKLWTWQRHDNTTRATRL